MKRHICRCKGEKYAEAIVKNVFSIGDLNIVNIHVHILLWGDDKFSNTVNDHLFSLVHIFIKKSQQF